VQWVRSRTYRLCIFWSKWVGRPCSFVVGGSMCCCCCCCCCHRVCVRVFPWGGFACMCVYPPPFPFANMTLPCFFVCVQSCPKEIVSPDWWWKHDLSGPLDSLLTSASVSQVNPSAAGSAVCTRALKNPK
jgi:hypothetical protein